MNILNDKNKAVIFMITSSFFYALLAANVKWITDIPVYEKFFFRTLFGLFLILLIIKKQKISLKGNNKVSLFARGIFGCIGGLLYYTAVSHTTIAESVTLSNIYPFFVVFLCGIFLKEKIQRFHVVALGLSFIGVLLIVRPGFSNLDHYYLIALFSSISIAISYTFLKVAQRTEPAEVIVFYYTLISAIACIPFIISDFVMPTPFQLLQLVLLGFCATFYQCFLTNAYKYAPASEVSIYSYATIIFSTIFGIFFWGEFPNFFSLLGFVAVLLGGFIIYKNGKSNISK